MALFKSSNPALSKNTFKTSENVDEEEENIMTLQGTVNKTLILLALLVAASLYTWNIFTESLNFNIIKPILWFGLIGGAIVGFIIIVKTDMAPILSPVYAILEGLLLGGLSAALNQRYPGIVIQAFILTFGNCFVLLIIYKLKLIKPTENFKLIVASVTGGLALFYIVLFGLSIAGIEISFTHDNSAGGELFSLFVIVIASMNLVVDFDFIEQGIKTRAPKYMEWYGAFALMLTLIWLYLEILRLLAKLRRK